MSSKFADWAARRGARSVPTARPAPAPVQPAQQPVVQAQPLARIAVVATPQLFVPASQDDVQTCMIVAPGNRDPYAELLARTPSLIGEDLSDGVDAMALAGSPAAATMSHWTPSANRTYGGRDAEGRGSFDTHLRAKYGTSVGAIRAKK